jgi:hypothetical protein
VNKDAFIPVSKLHRWRHARYKSGMSVEDIAKQDKKTILTIEESIRMVEAQAQIYGIAALESSTIEIVSHVKDLEKQALTEALLAEKNVYAHAGDNVGEVIASEPDHEIRLKAVSEITEKTKAVMSRHAKGNTQTTQVNVGVGVGVHTGGATNFESRLRDIVKKRQLNAANPGELATGGNIIDVIPEKEKLAVNGSSA